MFLELQTLDDLDRAIRFLDTERRRRLHIRWTVGAITEQSAARIAAAVGRPRTTSTRRPFRESDMRFILTDIQRATLSIGAVDKRGNPAPLEGVAWDSSDPALLAVDADPDDPTKATMRAVGPLGVVQVNVTADGVIGEGEARISGVLEVEIVASQATAVTITPGVPEDQA